MNPGNPNKKYGNPNKKLGNQNKKIIEIFVWISRFFVKVS
jgi:hypothetical protein